MKVKWTGHARKQRDEVANYIRRLFGARRKYQFKQEIRATADLLKRSPYIGKIDPMFEDRVQSYRSVIVNSLNKMVYRIDGDTIHVVAFWDTRMEPEEQATKVK